MVLEAKWVSAEEKAKAIASLLKRYGLSENSRILEVGCGNGRILINLAKLGFQNLVGVDISPIFIEDARRRACKHGVSDKVEFVVGDAKRLSEVLKNRVFDAVIFVWTSVIGYGTREDDVLILRECRKVSHEGSYLFILEHANRDRAALVHSLVRDITMLSELGNGMAMTEQPVFDARTSTIKNTWRFYRVEGKNLVFVDEVSFTLRLYSLHELIELAREAGWDFIEVFGDLNQSPFRPTFSSINAVFRAAPIN